MGSQRRNFVINTLVLIGSLVWLFAACAPTTEAPPVATSLPLPQVIFDAAPATLCQAATQIRFTLTVVGEWPLTGQAEWTLTRAGDDAILSQGEWQPGAGELFVAFPKGEVLPPGRYSVTLRAGNATLGAHTFAIAADTATVTALGLALTPSGPGLTRLPTGAQHFYLRYTYQGACPGAPYWITVRHKDAVICTHNATLPQASGAEHVACYRKDGAPLEDGAYAAELTLMGRAEYTFTFEVGDQPTPTPTAAPTPTPTAAPTPRPPTCAPLFAAAGLTSEGEPFLPQERFEWYTQAVYVGTRCENLRPGTMWASAWYRNGTNVREAGGVWNGQDSVGVLWDSITGVPRAPFLPSGVYSVTLTLDGSAPLTATFRLIPYVRPNPEPTTEP